MTRYTDSYVSLQLIYTLILHYLFELSPILWLETVHMLRVQPSGLDPAFDATFESQRLHLIVAALSDVVCKPARATRASAI